MHYTANPVEKLDLTVGDRVKFSQERLWWRVQAVSENFAVCVRQAEFEAQGVLRGACNLIGQGFGDGSYSEEQCAEMLTGFEYTFETDPNYLAAKAEAEAKGETRYSWPSPDLDLEISHRNWVRLEIVDVQRK
jgi:hypothetical protein